MPRQKKVEELDASVQEFLASLPKSHEPSVIALTGRTVYLWVRDANEPFPDKRVSDSEAEDSEPNIVTKVVESV